jgi:hypothetical protein
MFFSLLEPFKNGPRQWGQSPAKTGAPTSKPTIIITAKVLLFIISVVLIVWISPTDTLRQTKYAQNKLPHYCPWGQIFAELYLIETGLSMEEPYKRNIFCGNSESGQKNQVLEQKNRFVLIRT